MLEPRLLAARAVARVMQGASLDDVLEDAAARTLAPRDQSLFKALAYGVVREHSLLSALADLMLQKPLVREPELHALLLVGLYQIRSMRVPAYAAVQATVDACLALRKTWAKGLVNACLRRYQRERETLEAALPLTPEVQFSHPTWLIEQLRQEWPDHWQALLAAGNVPGPLTLRVNRRQVTRDEYRARLAQAGLAAEPVPAAPDALVLAEPVPVEQLPDFETGCVSVQDASAQLAVDLLEPKKGLRVLDACAAPGGKTAHLLEREELELLALDGDPLRLQRVQKNLTRLGLHADLVAADATEVEVWWNKQPFDRILIDAPCSGTGVIRRHPDIKWLRRPSDIPKLAAAQLKLLSALWPLLKPGGRLVYATCSILNAEGEDVVQRFRRTHSDAESIDIPASWGEALRYGRRLPPGGAFDGFYYAVLSKRG